MKIKINKNIGIEGTFNVRRKQEGCYVIGYEGIEVLINPNWCEIVKETKTIKILKDLKIGLKKSDILTEEIEEEKRYIKICSGKYKSICIAFDCFEYVEGSKEIELPNEFYFRHFALNKLFKVTKKENKYIVTDKLNNDKIVYYESEVKNNIKNGYWVIADKPVDKQKEYFEEQCKKHSDNNKLEQLKKVNDIKLKNLNKKVSKFIKVNTKSGFTTYIAKDKIVSVVNTEKGTVISVVDYDGTYTVNEKAEDIIKMLEE